MQVDHPAEWELVIASGIYEAPRCTFADRHYHRLDISWQPFEHEPNLDLVLQRHSRQIEKQQEGEVRELSSAPPAWRGLIRKLAEGSIVHAVRFLGNVRWLVDVAVVWPKSRSVDLENAILASIEAEDPDIRIRLWQAMGISMSVGSEFDLIRSHGKVGRIRWQFATGRKRGPKLTVERIALPEYWLKGTLRQWLATQMPPSHKVLAQEAITINRHHGEKLLSRGKVSALASIRGLAEITLDVAWLCPLEARAYHASISSVSREADISLPRDLTIRCCRAVPSPKR